MFAVPLDGTCQHLAFGIAALGGEVFHGFRVVHTRHVLFNDGAFVQVCSDIVRCGTDQFNTPIVRLVIRLGAFEAGQERVVNVDGTARQFAAQVVRQNLHVTRQHHQLGAFRLNDLVLFGFGLGFVGRSHRNVVKRNVVAGRQLVLLVLSVHVWLLLSSNDSVWRLHSESQKLGPLQTRIMAPPTPTPQTNPPQASQPKLSTPKPRAVTEAASESAALPAAISAVASAALPEPVDQSGFVPPPPQEAPPVAPKEATAGLVEKAVEAPQPQAAQDNALVAKAGDFPENIQINYKLTGQERGLNYFASGYLKWQVNPANSSPRNYEAELNVRAFLIGSRVWRSQGVLTGDGLAPKSYSDTWRSERAAHFDPDLRQISFSGNTPSAPLQAGAQDQVSLFIQMAAAVAAQNLKTGTELNIQTATSRDAVNW